MQYDIVIIGGNPAGATLADIINTLDANRKILVIRKEEESLVPCGIPYIFGTLKAPEDNIKPITPLQTKGVDFIFDTVIEIDSTKKMVLTQNNEPVFYKKLVLATGSKPFTPPIPGQEFQGVYTISKELSMIKELHQQSKKLKTVVIIGAGFIGVEMAEQLAEKNHRVILIESVKHILPLAFDEQMVEDAQQNLSSLGVTIRTGVKVRRINGKNNRVHSVELDTKEEIKTQGIILSVGYRPNTFLAEKTDLPLGQYGGICRDENFQTEKEDIYAIGDCAEHLDFFTLQPVPLMLASTAANEARKLGLYLVQNQEGLNTEGYLTTAATSIGNTALGSTGLTEKRATLLGISHFSGIISAMDKHPGKLPDTHRVKIKLLFELNSQELIGAQINGGPSTAEMLNLLSLAIQKKMTANDLILMQYGTQPMLTAGPGFYPIPKAAAEALGNYAKKALEV